MLNWPCVGFACMSVPMEGSRRVWWSRLLYQLYSQGSVIVKPDILILWLMCGYGYLFFSMPYTVRLHWVVSKWFIGP
jgi:hypothetical protein